MVGTAETQANIFTATASYSLFYSATIMQTTVSSSFYNRIFNVKFFGVFFIFDGSTCMMGFEMLIVGETSKSLKVLLVVLPR